MNKTLVLLGALVLGLSCRAAVAATATDLGQALTPVGAEKAASADGAIPAWTGGRPRGGPLSGEFPHDEQIDGDKPLFTISHDNYTSYADKLTEGHKELFKRYADYKMNVYPTRRTVGFPDFIYKATAANASTCKLGDSDDLDGCSVGFPFPLPKSGAEVIWNHKLRWRGEAAQRYNNQFIVQPSGEYQQTRLLEQGKFLYATDKSPVTLKNGEGEVLLYLSQTLEPPRVAGTFILVREKVGTGDSGRAAWIYSPGIKRIRRAPTVRYDNPYEGTDGNEFYDQVDMYSGALDLYSWKLVGKKEFYLPYNSDRIAGSGIRYADMIRPHHLNQDLPRYELHRYWVVEATLKPNASHTFKTRRFYVDEDGWNIEAIDEYDNKDQLYKFQEGHLVTFTNVQAAGPVPEVIYDFYSGRYFITAAFNQDKPIDVSVSWPDDHFSSSTVQKQIHE